jgi:glucose/arabinose dehydrogenase
MVLSVGPASAQAQVLRTQLVAEGLSSPLGFVQDPTNPDVQFIVQQGGLIRTFVNGVVGGTFLSLVGQISTGGERGLLGLAFAPDYATSRRFFVNFTNTNGHTVIARFRRDAVNPLLADPTSRADLQWPVVVGQPQRQGFITQPASNHNGGNLQFGPDGYLYIGMGDGGPGNDPNNQAQTPGSLLGKMLRINVNVPDNDPERYDIPAGNPFLADPNVFPEIWAFGFRNPWRYTFDNPARGGTGALLIADVGQITWEEVNYEPAGAGGRNYGWRIREGAHVNPNPLNGGNLPPYFLPLRDPFHEYFHDVEDRSITGGYVYRGANLGTFYQGRYFYADLFGKVWSIGLVIDGSGEATVAPGSLVDHTATMDPLALNFIVAFGEDSRGELYIVTLSGRIFRLVLELTTNGNFSTGMTGWTTFATPDPSYIVTSIVSGVLEFYRQPPPPGQTNQAVVIQATGVPAAPDMRFVAQFDLGNSSSVRKRVTVLIHDLDFDDITACTFWLASGAPMRTYRMFGHATQAWDNATISFYAANTGSNGGAYRLDNVSLQPDFAVSDERTDCVDPTAPLPPGGLPGPDLIVNGGFGTDLTPWGVFGQIVWQLTGGVFEFYRPAGVPAGVVLQQTGANFGTGAILTATFQLGNSSGVLKRVTVLLHSADFLDLAACTFWLPPGQPLSPYTMRMFATQPWTNATVSVYPATVGIDQALRLDDVTLRLTPAQAVRGTECIQPVTPSPGLAAASSARPAMTRAPAIRRED